MNVDTPTIAQPALASTPDAGGHGRIADIEVLRAVAVIFVLLEHLRINLFPWTGGDNIPLFVYFGMWDGVDLFFAISGFVIARSLLPTLAAAKGTTGYFNATLVFWTRRVWRLLPSAWLWIAIILLCAVTFNRSHAFGGFRANFEGALAAVLDIANFRIIEVFGHSDPGASFPYWSLSLEEQFYLLLPLIVFVSRRWLPYALGAGVAAQLFVDRSGSTHYINLVLNQVRSDAMLLGVLIAVWSRDPTYRLFEPVGLTNRPILRLGILIFLVFLLGAAGSLHLHLAWFQVGIVALVSAVMVLIASYDQNYFGPDNAFKRVMIWIGSRSYALYLIHIPAYFMTREIWFRLKPAGTIFTSTYTLRFVLTAALLLLVFTELNYRLVEVPLRRRGARIARNLALRPI